MIKIVIEVCTYSACRDREASALSSAFGDWEMLPFQAQGHRMDPIPQHTQRISLFEVKRSFPQHLLMVHRYSEERHVGSLLSDQRVSST